MGLVWSRGIQTCTQGTGEPQKDVELGRSALKVSLLLGSVLPAPLLGLAAAQRGALGRVAMA